MKTLEFLVGMQSSGYRWIMCWALLVATFWSAAASAAPTLVQRSGLNALGHPEYLPFIYPAGTQTLQFSSYDLAAGNGDGDFDRAFTRYVDDNGEHVIFDAYGPGSLNRQQINIWLAIQQVGNTMKLGFTPSAGESRIRYYFDDERKPRIDMSVDELFGGKHAPFNQPFGFTARLESPEFKRLLSILPDIAGGKAFALQYLPLPFEKRLKVTFVPSAGYKSILEAVKLRSIKDGFSWGSSWYQFTYLLYPPGTVLKSWPQGGGSSDRVRAAWRHIGEDPKPTAGNRVISSSVTIAPGKSALLLDAKGQGSIASLKLRLAPFSEETFFNVRIRMSWDDEHWTQNGGRLAVDMPLGVFFGGGSEDYTARSQIPGMRLATLLYGYDGTKGTFYSYWPMPYWSSAKIELISNASHTITVEADIAETPKDVLAYGREEASYFYAKQTKNTNGGGDIFATVFQNYGAGHVVATRLDSQEFAMDGDEFTYFDGSRSPQIHGNGIEDDHNQGWGGGALQQPLWGALFSGFEGASRLYLSDPYVFNSQIKVNYEYSEPILPNSKTDVVMYYYMRPAGGSELVETDSVDVGRTESEKEHQYSIEGETWNGARRSGFDGYQRNVEWSMLDEEGRAFKGRSRFTIAVSPLNTGVRLRRLLSREGNGVQTAQIFVDGVKLERPWHIVFNSSAPANQAWVESDYELPASLTRGKSKLKIEVRYQASTRGELNEYHYWVFSHLH